MQFNTDLNWCYPPPPSQNCVRERRSFFTVDCDWFVVIQHLQKSDSNLTDNPNRCWWHSQSWNLVEFGVIVNFFVQNSRNCMPWRSFISTRTVLYWNIMFLLSNDIEPKTSKDRRSMEYLYWPITICFAFEVPLSNNCFFTVHFYMFIICKHLFISVASVLYKELSTNRAGDYLRFSYG